MNTIRREEYLNKLIAFKDKQIIKVITGIRRCGKSTLMEMFCDHLRNSGITDEQIIYINLEDYDNKELCQPDALHKYIKERLAKDKMTYIFIDEVQQCAEFPKVIDSFFIKKNTDIYLTGSNAVMLSSEIATMLSGRYVEISMLPLSFKEFVSASDDNRNLSEKYKEYVEYGAFPYVLQLKDHPREIRDYLDSLFNTIIVKDIASRKKLTDIMMLESVVRFVYDNISNQLSTKKIADTMTSDGRKIDTKTIEKYLDALISSFAVYKAERYNVRGKQRLKTLEKYYAVDIGLRYALLGSQSTDVGRMLENIVYLELLRREYEVYVGKIDDLEVDFVAVDEDKRTTYFQVAATVRDSKTLERELAPLQKINDHYQKYILTLDEDPDADYNGIRRINVLEWLLRANS